MQSRVRSLKTFAETCLRCPGEVKTVCTNCGVPFSSDNVYTSEGWTETQRVGICEACSEDILDFMTGSEE